MKSVAQDPCTSKCPSSSLFIPPLPLRVSFVLSALLLLELLFILVITNVLVLGPVFDGSNSCDFTLTCNSPYPP